MPNCVVKKCKHQTSRNKKQDGITYHSFPVRNDILKEKWIKVIRLNRNEPSWNPKVRSVVCSTHFEKEDLYYTKKGLRRVVRNGYPKHLLSSPDQSVNIVKNEPTTNTVLTTIPDLPQPSTSNSHVSAIRTMSTTSIQSMEEEIESNYEAPRTDKLRQRILRLVNRKKQMQKKIKTLNQKVRRLNTRNKSLKVILDNLIKQNYVYRRQLEQLT